MVLYSPKTVYLNQQQQQHHHQSSGLKEGYGKNSIYIRSMENEDGVHYFPFIYLEVRIFKSVQFMSFYWPSNVTP